MTLADRVRRRLARAPEAVRAVVLAASDADERVLAWGELIRGEGWLVATSRGLRRIGPGEATEDADPLGWHEIGFARWSATADGGGSFEVVALDEVEPGVQARRRAVRHLLADAGELPAVIRKRVDRTVVDSRRTPLPGGGAALLVARRLPGQAEREWTVVFDDDADRFDPASRDAARQRLAEALAAERPE